MALTKVKAVHQNTEYTKLAPVHYLVVTTLLIFVVKNVLILLRALHLRRLDRDWETKFKLITAGKADIVFTILVE